MSAPNFRPMLYGMPMVCGKTYGQMKEDYESELGEEFSDGAYEYEAYNEFEEAEAAAEEFSECLKYHDVTVEAGRYDSFQFYVQEKYDNYFDLDRSSPYCIKNEDAHYYFDVCRSVAIREADREKRKIEKWLCSLTDYGYNVVSCVGHFGNGEAVYRIVKERGSAGVNFRAMLYTAVS